jgi:mannose/fructose/N-acetylgalactosamine-specific phosphotransferase system component IID
MKKTTFMAVYWRSFFLQALWNFERLQNVGFAFGMLPIFRLLYPEPAQRRDVLLRHLSFFNTRATERSIDGVATPTWFNLPSFIVGSSLPI